MTLISLNQFNGMKVSANDGEFGTIGQFLFDDESFAIRYVVVNTGNWLTRKEVLISPISIANVDFDRAVVSVDLSKEQIEKSPSVDTDMPVSREKEKEYHDYYTWPYYWEQAAYWQPNGPLGMPMPAGMPRRDPPPNYKPASANNREVADTRLRATKEVTGYKIQATDGVFGHVEDFIIDDLSWVIHYIVVDTISYWPSKWVLVSFECISDIRWSESRVSVDLPKEVIQSGTEYVPGRPIPKPVCDSLLRYQGKPHYWKPGDPRNFVV